MKILFAWVFKINTLNGGVERVTSIVMDGLRSRGYHCDNIICENDNHDFYLNNEVTDDNHLSLEQLKTYLEERQYDVIVCQDGYSISMTKTFREAAPFRTKVVTYLHNSPTMWEEVFCVRNVKEEIRKASSFKIKLFWLVRLLIHPIWSKHALKGIACIYKTNYQYCDKYVLLSQRFFPDMKRYLEVNADNKLYAIPNPLSFDIIESPDILKKKKKEVLMVTRLDETQKNISFSLLVWEIIQKKGFHDWYLRIVGHGPDEAFLKNMVMKYQIPNVLFEGKQMPIPYYETASIFMMTSNFEGWGMTITESLQYGVVPIARDSYLSLHDIISDGDNGYIVDSNSTKVFAEKVMFLMENKEKRESTALNGLESVNSFTKENVVMKWGQLLNNL
jgi:glycosyltransferase involved in cell wall biosynthesis